MKTSTEILDLAEILYFFQRIDDQLEYCDIILVPCSHDIRVADYASKLFLSWYGWRLIFSWWVAHQDDLLSTGWNKTEAEIFSDRAIKLGVSPENIICEKEAKNTGENIQKSMNIIEQKNILCDSILLVQKPYMQRRAFATFKKIFSLPYNKLLATAPQIAFLDYPNEEINMDTLINILVWDIQRLIIYPKMWYQIPIDIPQEVLDAYEELKKRGFTKHISK